MPEFDRVSPGDELKGNLTARWYNYVTHDQSLPAPQAQRQASDLPANVVLVKNTTVSEVPRGGVLGIDGAIVTASNSANTFAANAQHVIGVAPNQDQHSGRVCVALEPIPAGKIRRAVVVGVAAAKVNVTNAGHRYANIVTGDTAELASGSTGAIPMTPAETGTGVQWATVFLPGVGQSATCVKATVDSDVATSATTFNATKTEVVFGEETGTTLTVRNSFAEEFSTGDTLILWKRDADGEYEPDRKGSGAGGSPAANNVYYELTQDMALADAAKLAKPVLADDTMNAAAAAFYVVDSAQQYVGKAAFTDAIGAQNGYRGYCYKFTDDYNSTGVAGYRIINQEGPMMLIAVTLSEDGQSSGTTTVAPLDADAQLQYGNPTRGRYPAADSGTGAFECHDDLGVIEFAESGDKWMVLYDEADDHYNFLHPITGAKFHRIRGKLKGSSVTRSSTSFVLDNVEAVSGASPAATAASEITVSVPVTAKVDIPSGATDWIYAQWNDEVGSDETSHWDCGDGANHHWFLRGREGFTSASFRVLVADGNTESDIKWVSVESVLQELAGWTAGNNQSIGHDASDTPEWQDDGSC